MFDYITRSKSWIKVIPINEGWSRDKKYHVYDINGNEYLLRLSSLDSLEKKKWQYKMLQEIEKLNINAPKPIEFGVIDDQVYLLLTWLKGEKAENAIQNYNEVEQYNLGYNAGKIVQKLHSIKIDSTSDDWWYKYQEKIIMKINRLNELDIYLPKKKIIINHVLNNIHLAKDRPSKLQHGDFHLGNMIINNDEIFIIDFDKMNISDPIDEFKPFCWNVLRSPSFEVGLIKGYLDDNIPSYFFPILSLYAAESMLSSLPWAITFGDKEVKTTYEVINHILYWFDDFKLTVPTWFNL